MNLKTAVHFRRERNKVLQWGVITVVAEVVFWSDICVMCTEMCCVYTDAEKMAQFAQEERNIREENLRLQRRLQLEMERRENLCRHLSESESSLEMDDER